MTGSRAWMVAAVAASTTLWPSLALACSVCVGPQSLDTRNAFIAMTAFMTFTPLTVIFSVAYWLWRRFKAMDAEDEERARAHAQLAESKPGLAQ